MKKDKEEKVNLEEKVEELEKSNKWMKGILLSLVGVFFMVVCIYAGVVIGKSMNDGNKEKTDKNDVKVEEENKEEEIEEKEEEIELEQLTKDNAVVKKLFEVFREDKNCKTNFLWTDYDEDVAKRYIAYANLDASAFSQVKCGELDDSFIDGLYCAMNDESMKYYGNNETKYENAIKNETTKSFTAESLEKKYAELFGKNAVVEHSDFSIGEGPVAHYDSNKKIYAEYKCECGGDCVGITQTLDSITQNGTSLTLHTTTIYKEDNSKKSVTYTFKYEKETGNYIFVSRVAA